METETEQLIKDCRAGSDDARRRLYTRYAKPMLALCYRYTGNIDAAHDVLHDGFVKIFTNFNFRGECSLDSWIYRVMMTQAVDYLRRERRLTQLVSPEAMLPDIADEEDLAEAGSDLAEEVLMKFVAELPDGCRTVFNLYVFEEKSHKEIARLLYIKEHSSTSQLHRAKQLLAQRIKAYIAHGKEE